MFNSPKLSPQADRVYNELLKGKYLTNKKAVDNGIGSLSSRIAELRKAGVDVIGEWAADSHGRRYRKYSLSSTKQ